MRQHEQIDDVAVAGVLREDGLTEVPRAYVIRKKDAQELTANDIYGFARDRLASYKALDGGVVFVDSIPRTAVGKIQRFKLTGKRCSQVVCCLADLGQRPSLRERAQHMTTANQWDTRGNGSDVHR